MEEKFWKTRAGAMTKAFLAIMIAFAMILAGLYGKNKILCEIGFVIIIVSMLYAPYDTLKRKTTKK
ncbi:MAG: hypothetical protein UDG85_02370 [Anaerostipes hadrus]|nr:hypothetical protein [Anaerostipes hadrus]